jgi:hypothetical protein
LFDFEDAAQVALACNPLPSKINEELQGKSSFWGVRLVDAIA